MPPRDEFVWPPNRPKAPKLAVNPAPSAPAPPPPAPPPPATAQPERTPANSASAERTWWHELEHDWLGAESASWAQRVRDNPHALDAPLGALTPPCPRCGHDLPPQVLDCPACAAAAPPPWLHLVRLGPYDGVLRDSVLEVKHTAFASLARAMGRDLGAHARGRLEAAGMQGPALVTWVPLPSLRRLSRGIDHARALARGVASTLDAPLVRLLSRRHRPTQRGLSPAGRARNVAGSMRPALLAPRASELSGVTILVVDDVLTTGATMREACKAILRSSAGAQPPPRFFAIVAAVTPPRDGPARQPSSSSPDA